MSELLPQFWFRSKMFPVVLGEDAESNPFCYGRELGRWLQARFADHGYTPEPVFAEDWGWCVMLSRTDGLLWLGCGNDRSLFYDKVTPEQHATFIPEPGSFTWTAFVGTDQPAWSLRFGKRKLAIERLSSAAREATVLLGNVLQSERGIELVPEP